MTESTNVTVTIERSKGLFGSATVFWSVFKISTSVLASDDFIMASGSVEFAESEDEKVGEEIDMFSTRSIVWTKICRVSVSCRRFHFDGRGKRLLCEVPNSYSGLWWGYQ